MHEDDSDESIAVANLNSQISKKKQAQNQQPQADIVQSQVILFKLNLKFFNPKISNFSVSIVHFTQADTILTYYIIDHYR